MLLNWAKEIHACFAPETAADLIRQTLQMLEPGRHGDWPRWQAALAALPETGGGWSIQNGILVAGEPAENLNALTETLREFIPWRKGPLNLAGVEIDTEWRSDWKWQRIAPSIDLAGQRVLDIGAGNGYFGFQMLDAGARQVIACDPTLLFMGQYLAIRHFAGAVRNLLLPLRFEVLPAESDFDWVFSMGVLYHRREPLKHLKQVRQQLKPGGRLVLETLVIPDREDCMLEPSGRYANMRNVHHLPSVSRLLRWLKASGFVQLECIDQTATTIHEQRSTDWMPFHSLAQALSADQSRTLEGHPPPLRATILAETAG